MRLTAKNTFNTIPAIGLGTMPVAAFYHPLPKREEAVTLVRKAFEMGYRIIDTAHVYGNGINGESEKIVAEAFKQSGLSREEVFLSTKGGLSFNERGDIVIGGKRHHLLSDIDASLRRLETDYLDCYFLHRIDPNTPLEESLTLLAEQKQQGRIRYIGISEVDAEMIEQSVSLLKGLGATLDVVQNECSLLNPGDINNGVFDACEKHGIAYMPYSPIGRGLVASPHAIASTFSALDTQDVRQILPRYGEPEALEHNKALVSGLSAVAHNKVISESQLCLAWLLRVGTDKKVAVYPIPGTKSLVHLEENAKAEGVRLTDEEMAISTEAIPEKAVQGARYPETFVFAARADSSVGSPTDGERLRSIGIFHAPTLSQQAVAENDDTLECGMNSNC